MQQSPEQRLQYAVEQIAADGAAGITVTGKTDGGCAQILAIMSGLLFSRMTGIPYYHTPLSHVKFADGPDWASRWEKFFNLGLGERQVTPDVPVTPLEAYDRNSVVAVPHFHFYIQKRDAQIRYLELRDSFLDKYYSNPKPEYDSDHVAVHIRRGDVTEGGKWARRFTADAKIISAVKEIQRGREVQIFSQGIDPEDFNEIDQAQFFIDHDVFDTVHRMVRSEAIVMAKSTMSYIAGLLGPSEVAYDPWFHKPLPGWKVV